jgi:hypothetical protein
MLTRLCHLRITLGILAGFALLPNTASAQLSDTASWTATVQNEFGVVANCWTEPKSAISSS